MSARYSIRHLSSHFHLRRHHLLHHHHRSHPHIFCQSQLQSQLQLQSQFQWRRKTTQTKPKPNKREAPTPTKRRLDVAIVGPPNAGKSQFLNTVTNTTISAVSRKRHTTRNGVLATYNHTHTHTDTNTNNDTNNNTNNDTTTQLAFIDTPGFVQYNSPKDETLYRELITGATTSMDRADYTLIVIDAAKYIDDALREELIVLMLAAHHSRGRVYDYKLNEETGEMEEIVNDANDDANDDDANEDANRRNSNSNSREKFAIVLNKVDLVNPKNLLLDIAQDVGALGDACVRYRGEMEDNLSIMDDATNAKNETNNATNTNNNNNNNNNNTTNDNNNRPILTQEEEKQLEHQYPPVFFISSLQNDGINDVINHLLQLATPTNEFILPPNQKTSMTMTERIQEIIREKIYRCLHREVPHSITQVNRVLKRGKTREGKVAVRIDQDIIVKTKSHHRLVMGRGGMTLKRIEDTARRDLLLTLRDEGIEDVFLNLHVKFTKSKQHTRQLESEREGVIRGMVK